MNLFKLMQGIRAMAQAGKIDFPGAVKYLTDLGVEMNGIVHQALKNVFKEGKARDPEFGNVVQKLQIDDQGIPFNPNTLKSTVEKRGVENLFENKSKTFADELAEGEGVETFETILPTKKVPKNIKYGQLDYDRIAAHEDIDVELIRGKTWDEIRAIVAAIRDKADGGRIGFQVGGLSSQAQSIYDAWIAAGHTEADVLDYLTSRGLYGGEEATGIETIVNTAPNIGGGGGEASENLGYGKWGNLDKSTKKTVMRDVWSDELQTAIPQPVDIYQDSGNLWKTWEGGNPTHAGLDKVQPFIGNLMSNFLGIEDEGYQEGDIMGTYSDYNRHWSPNYKDLTFIQKWKADNQRNKELKDMQNKIEMRNAAIAAQAAAAKAQAEKTAAGIGPITGHGQAIDPGHVRDIGGGFHEYKDPGTAASYEGSFKDGGLASMFTRRR